MSRKYLTPILSLLGLGALAALLGRKESPVPFVPNKKEDEEPTEPNNVMVLETNEQKRERVVQIALSQVGKNDAAVYWEDAYGTYPGPSYAWCGVFALWVLRQAGLTDAKWIVGKGFIYPLGLEVTYVPKPGDIAYFEKYQHQAIVGSVNDDGTVSLINGNGTGGAVTESRPQKSKVSAFYSIQRLL